MLGGQQGTTAMIALKHIFGINSNMKNHVQYLSDHKIVYPAGHNIVVYNTDDKTQVHIGGVESYRGFSNFCVSLTRKFLAYAERGEKPAIYFYETIRQARRKQFQFSDANFKEITAMAFAPSAEAKTFACLSSFTEGGSPDVYLYYFTWDKAKHYDPIKVVTGIKMTEVCFPHGDANTVTCLGPGVFKCFKLQDQRLKQVNAQIGGLPEGVSQQYVTHTWLTDGNVVVAAENGQLLILDAECEFKAVLPDSPKDNKIEVIIPYAKGFICAGATMTIYFYETDPDHYYKRSQVITWKNHENKEMNITSLSVVPGLESKLCFCTANNGVYAVNIKNENALGIDEIPLEQLTEPFPSGPIISMDVCTRKPLIVTAEEQTIRIWNFEDMKLECCKTFNETILSVAIHPSGYILAIGNTDRVKLMYIGINNQLHDANRNFSYIKNCRALKFSNGGQYLAASNSGGSSHTIHLICTYTGEGPKRFEFKGHSNKIKSLTWSKDDSILLSAGLDGAVYSWKIGEVGEGGNRTDYISPEKGCQMNGAIYNSELKIIYATGTDLKIKVLDEEKETSFTKTDAVLNCLAMTNSAKLLFAGISDEKFGGLIRCYKLPLGSNSFDYLAHDGSGIENIAITFDDTYLITAGRDGCLMLFEIKDKEARAMKNKDGYTKYADEIFMTKKDLDDLKQQKEQQRNNKREAQNAGNQFSLTGKDDIIKQRREIQKTVMEAEAAKYATLENNIKEKQQDHIKQLEGLQKTYEDELQEIENTYQRKTREEVASYEGYKRIQEEKREEYREKITALINEHNESIKSLEDRYSREIDAENREFNKARNEKEELEREHREIMEQIKSETEQEIKDLESKFITENNLLQDAALKIKSEVSVNNKKIASLELDAAELDDKLTEYKEQKKKLEDQRNELREDIKNYKREIDERDRIITEKEKRIYELKKRAQELEKFKFVLDYKIKELRRDIGPRDLQIQEMKKETNIMDNNLKKLSSTNNTLGLIVEELDRKQADMRNQITEQSIQIGMQKSKIKSFKDDVYQAVQYIQDYKKLSEETEKLKNKYAKDHVKTLDIDLDIHSEYISQKNYLEKSVAMLKKNLQKDNEIHKQDNRRIMRENVELIKKINQLRRENRDIKRTIKGVEKSPDGRETEAGSDSYDKLIAEKKKFYEEQTQDIAKLRKKVQALIDENESLKPTR